MAQSQFSRYCNGHGDVSAGILSKIIAEFPEVIAADLVRAYLLDQCPLNLQPLVEIHSRAGAVQESTPDGLENLPADVRTALRFIGSRCHERPVLDLVIDLSRLLRGEVNGPQTGDQVNPVDLVTAKRERRAQATLPFQAKKA